MRNRLSRMLLPVGIAMTALAPIACVDKPQMQQVIQAMLEQKKPDELPSLQNPAVLPFVYPRALYTQKIQGNVTLSIVIDDSGHVTPESTQVAESSGHPEFDSAAVAGARLLRFSPAKIKGVPEPVRILFPVFFRHPRGGPMPGDSLLPGGAAPKRAP